MAEQQKKKAIADLIKKKNRLQSEVKSISQDLGKRMRDYFGVNEDQD